MPEELPFLLLGLTPIPVGIPLTSIELSHLEDGMVVFEGVVGIAFAGVFTGIDVEFVLRDDGIAIWDNMAFRGLKGRIQAIKQGRELVIHRI